MSSTAYRVVVEALTNVRRHAPGTDVTVTLDRSAAALTVEVGNGAPAGRPQQRGERAGGLGLPGLAERVAALGGALTAGPRPGGGWRPNCRSPVAQPPSRAGKAEPR
ncbi:ATP-binding protein [Kitasatospora sp. NPDC088391]|uniref:ATP-binding protein n=1 Tax=Kitasatospora sp. NPDC088391 TaxID=3364074 RepID=UPI00382902F7